MEQIEVVVENEEFPKVDGDEKLPTTEVDSWGSFNYEDIEAEQLAGKIQEQSFKPEEIPLEPGQSGDDGMGRLKPAKSQDSQGFLGDISLSTMEAMCQEAEKQAANKSNHDSSHHQTSSSPPPTSSSPPPTSSSSSSSSPVVCLTSTPVSKSVNAKNFELPLESPVVVAEEVRRRKLLYKSEAFRDKCQSPFSDSGVGSGSSVTGCGASKDLAKYKSEDSGFSNVANGSKVLKTLMTNMIKNCDTNLLFKKSENCSTLTSSNSKLSHTNLTSIAQNSSSKETPTTKLPSRSLGMSRRGVPTNLLYSAERKSKDVASISSTPIPTVPTLSLEDCREKLSDSEEEEEEKENTHQSVKFKDTLVPTNQRQNIVPSKKMTPLPKVESKSKTGKGVFNAPRRSGSMLQMKEITKGIDPLFLNGNIDPSDDISIFNEKSTNPPFSGFSTASGDKVNVSKKALLEAQNLFAAIPDENRYEAKNDSNAKEKFSSSLGKVSMTGFSTAGGGKVSISAEALKNAQEKFEDDNTNSGLMEKVPMTGFSCTETKVNISAQALKKAQRTFESEVVVTNPPSLDNVPMTGFSTASGGKVNISTEALKNAQKKFEVENINSSPLDNVPMTGFSTASGGKVNISTEALRNAQKKFEVEDIKSSPLDNVPMTGFSTASGGKVAISAEALKKAKKNFDAQNTSSSSVAKVPMTGFSTAAGGKVNISEEALIKAQRTFESETERINASSLDDVPMTGFSTAGGGKVKISAEALKNAQKKFEAEVNNSPSIGNVPMSGFSTATGGKVNISEEALKNAKITFESLDNVPMSGFSTASGEKVKISAGALKNAQKKFEGDSDFGGKLKETTKFNSPLSSVGFSTAGGSNIKISSEALEKAKNKFDNGGAGDNLAGPSKIYDDFDDDVGFDDDSDLDLINIAESSERQYLNQQRKPMTCHPYKRGDLRDQVLTCGPFMFDEAPEETAKDTSSTGFQAPYVPGKAKGNNPAKRQLEEDFDVRCLFVKRIKLAEDEMEEPNMVQDSIIECRQLARKKQLALIESKKRKKVRPMTGVLLRAQMSQMEDGRRATLHATCRRLDQKVVRPNVLAVTAQNASDFVFSGEDYFSFEAVKNNTNGIALGDGAVIILRDNGDVGYEEFEATLAAMPGVDPQLIPLGWSRNHYGMVVWKLASMERRVEMTAATSALSPANVIMQLKLRYDRELDRVERPIIRKIAEKDEPPSTCMVLCVSAVAEDSMEVTDGWYSLACKVDAGSQLHRMVQAGRIKVGTKIITVGAEMEGGEQGCHPLEAEGKMKLVLHVNSTRRMKWWAKLGPAPPFQVRMDSLVAGGGPTPFLKLTVARTYPRMYYVKDQGGKSSYMTEKNWNRMEKDSKSVEEIYRQVEKEMCGKSRGRRRVTKAMVKGVECGKELLELMESALDPDLDLTESQREAVSEAREEKGRLIQEEVSKRMREKGAVATPLVKMRLVGEDGDGKSGLLTVWRPGEMGELFVEERVLGVSGATVSRVEGKVVHLTASRMTRYKEMGKCSGSDREINLSRRIIPFQEMAEPEFSPLFSEVDTVGFVASLGDASKSAKGFQTVTLCDLGLNCVRLMVWGGLAAMGLKDVLVEGQVVACKDLEWRNTVNQQLPALYVREYSTVTANPKDSAVLSQINNFKAKIGKDFLASAKAAAYRGARLRTNTATRTTVGNIKNSSARSSSSVSSSPSSVASAWNVSDNLMQSQRVRNHEKLGKLDAVAGEDTNQQHHISSQTILPQYKPPRISR